MLHLGANTERAEEAYLCLANLTKHQIKLRRGCQNLPKVLSQLGSTGLNKPSADSQSKKAAGKTAATKESNNHKPPL